MTKLSGKTVAAPENFSVHNHTQANTPTEVNYHYFFLRFGDPNLLLGLGYQARIIINIRWQPCFIRNILGEGFISCVQVGVIDTPYRVYKTGHTDAYTGDFIL